MEAPKNYDHKQEEQQWQKYWEEQGIFTFDPKKKGAVYSIDTPPPTVSGKMHIGHAFSYSQQDFIARYRRMKGENVLYPFGTDDNGLPTERLVEKMKNVKGSKMERQAFIDLCQATLKEIRPGFIQAWKNIGVSADFNMCYSTIDDNCRKISQQSFLDLHKAGRTYQRQAPTMWCPTCETAISQVEMEDKEMESTFNDIVFKLEDGSELIIATTRPELLPACVAIFAHPEDERYKHLFGKKAKVPLFDLWVTIRPSERADPEKGTGILMCCTFGDQDDIQHYLEYHLDLRVAITKDGRMTNLAGEYEGLKIRDARAKIITDLTAAGLLLRQRKITHAVNVHERCATEIEILETKQWFVRYLDMKEQLLEAGRALHWYPDHMRHRYENWIRGLAWDWCISRQRFFGVPFPVWYCKQCGEAILAESSQLPVDPLSSKPSKACACGSTQFVPEKDVMDTWATSSLTPDIVRSLAPSIKDKLMPMSLRPQAHDIISFWLFNTVVKSQMHHDMNPWKDVMISGWALDPHGRKMSKSKGNTVEPEEVIEKYGADCVRFWSATSKLGEDMPYQEKDLVTAKKMITKLWNAARFAQMHLGDFDGKKPDTLEPMDEWILAELNLAITQATNDLEQYEFYRARSAIENFFWHKLCDNYLEIVKDRLYNPDKYGADKRKSAQYALYIVFMDTLKVLAPIMPFITESVYQNFFKRDATKSIHLLSWPVAEHLTDAEAQLHGALAVSVIGAVRRLKSTMQKSLGNPVAMLTITCTDAQRQMLEPYMADILGTTKSEAVTFGEGGVEPADEAMKVNVTLV